MKKFSDLFLKDGIEIRQIKESSYEAYNYGQLYHYLESKYDNHRLFDPCSIFEGSSVFDNCYNMSLAIADIIDKKFNLLPNSKTYAIPADMLREHNVDNIFFDICYIELIKYETYEKFHGDGYYDTELGHGSWNDEEQKFTQILIQLRLPKDFYSAKENKVKSCLDLLIHEFRHVAQDQKYHLKGTSLYEKTKNRNLKYKDVDFNRKSTIINYLNKDECLSYISQLDGEFQGKKFKTIKDATIWMEDHSNIWKMYLNLKDAVEKDKEFKVAFYKSWDKFINHVGHILNDHTDNQIEVIEHCYRDFMEPIERYVTYTKLQNELEKIFI